LRLTVHEPNYSVIGHHHLYLEGETGALLQLSRKTVPCLSLYFLHFSL